MQDPRRSQAEDWARSLLKQGFLASHPISSDASFRRYFRLKTTNRSLVLMDAPPEHENTQAFLEVGKRLARAGLHVPAILAADPTRGFALLEDLGDKPYHHVLDEQSAPALFEDALAALLHMQTRADAVGLPDYDTARLLAELALFVDWFLTRHWQVVPTDDELDDWDSVCALLIRWAMDQPQAFCHRDFMPRNLMLTDPNPGIIDFQDAVRGPVSYDPVCLFRDAFLSWPEPQVDGWLEDYRQRARAAGLALPATADLWRRTCDLMGVQRHLKVIGIFARIRYRDGKPRYLEDTPRFFSYLQQAIARNPELIALDELLKAWRARARDRAQ